MGDDAAWRLQYLQSAGDRETVQLLDAFHEVKLGAQVVDEVRRRVQQQTLRRRGHKDDPL